MLIAVASKRLRVISSIFTAAYIIYISLIHSISDDLSYFFAAATLNLLVIICITSISDYNKAAQLIACLSFCSLINQGYGRLVNVYQYDNTIYLYAGSLIVIMQILILTHGSIYDRFKRIARANRNSKRVRFLRSADSDRAQFYIKKKNPAAF